MGTAIKYDSNFLNHVELSYRPGEGELAIQLFETLGCTVVDITKELGSSGRYLGVFSESAGRDSLNNVLYVSEMREPQLLLEDLIGRRMQDDVELRAAVEQNDLVRKKPGYVSHFGLRFLGFEELEAVISRLTDGLPAELTGRVTVYPPFQVQLPALGTEVLQTFIHTDIVGPGFFPFGQLIELQAQRPLQE